MFKNLLIPLDGSPMAEVSLPIALYIAQTLGARITLFHVIEHNARKEIHGERHLTDALEAEGYLKDVATRAFPSHIHVDCVVTGGAVDDVAASIFDHVKKSDIDLVVMCVHGRSGFRGFVFGRIAQQVTANGIPVLLVPPVSMKTHSVYSCERILVPLDGNPAHEKGLRGACSLAKKCNAEILLIMAVHSVSTLSGEQAAVASVLPVTTQALLNFTGQEAKEYLHRHEVDLESEGITVHIEVRRGEPSRTVISAAEDTKSNLIILTTHGKAGLGAFWAGSAAAKITNHSVIPVLLIPAY
jgi:nucleotide-binding universal stress UspA family protein